MWLLGRILPIVIGDLVPEDDEKYGNYILMMKIVDILFAPKLSEDHVGYLACLIREHHKNFVQLYPDDSIIPKLHFMIHMPRLIQE